MIKWRAISDKDHIGYIYKSDKVVAGLQIHPNIFKVTKLEDGEDLVYYEGYMNPDIINNIIKGLSLCSDFEIPKLDIK